MKYYYCHGLLLLLLLLLMNLVNPLTYVTLWTAAKEDHQWETWLTYQQMGPSLMTQPPHPTDLQHLACKQLIFSDVLISCFFFLCTADT